MKKILIIIPVILGLFTSCEKEIQLDLNNAEPEIVIEGSITDTEGPYFVKISKTVSFYDPEEYPAVKNAMIVITDNLGNADILTEVEDGLYKTNSTIGTPGNTYNLSVKIGEDNYYATSTMPEKVNLDSVAFEARSGFGDDPDYYVTIPYYKDPPARGNNYRFVLKVNDRIDIAYYLKNDVVGNGEINNRPIYDVIDGREINKNDSVEVEMRCIDLPTYRYFNTLTQIINSGPNGGVTPSNPPNNITGKKALGLFSAYTSQKIYAKVN